MPLREKRVKYREPKLHRIAEKLTEILIYFIVIFSPWAFGASEPWSIWTLNISAYSLGVLLLVKWTSRLTTKFKPWPHDTFKTTPKQCIGPINKYCNLSTTIFLLILLSYILISAINARGWFDLSTNEYTYFDGVNKYLPHSYDGRSTWFLFWQYLGLIILFWSLRDWLKGDLPSRTSLLLNPRLKRLLFLICLNGGVLALECIIQRLYYGDHQGKLLFLIDPSINKTNLTQFGPFAYRSNAASYLNLIWPLSLGLFIQMGQENLEHGKRRIGNGPELLLIPCTILAASGPIVTSARGGALIMVGLLALVFVSMMFMNIRSKFLFFSISMSLFIGLGTAYLLGWEKIEPRLVDLMEGFKGRSAISEITIKMISEYPAAFGSGPGSFETVAQFELDNSFTTWESWAHNDYLEFYLTFGKAGGAILFVLVLLITFQSVFNFWNNNDKNLQWFCFIAILGVAIHAIMDFPLQVHSILVLLIIINIVNLNIKTDSGKKLYSNPQ